MKRNFNDFKKDAGLASRFLKAISNPNRLMVLCKLVEKQMSVNQLLEDLDISQSALSQNLRLMKEEGIVGSKKQGNQNFYYIKNKVVKDIFKILYKNFCGENK